MRRRPRRRSQTAWQSIGARPAVAEQALDLECEISVMAARNPSGEVRSYPAARNHHENQILAWSVLPAGVPRSLESRAEALAAAIMCEARHRRTALRGDFCHAQGELFVNELAPRPHNSYHQSERGCVTSQFEQLVRAVCNLPLGRHGADHPAPSSTCSAMSGSTASRTLPRPSPCPACDCISMRNTRRAWAARWGICRRRAPRRKKRWSVCWKRSVGSNASAGRGRGGGADGLPARGDGRSRREDRASCRSFPSRAGSAGFREP